MTSSLRKKPSRKHVRWTAQISAGLTALCVPLIHAYAQAFQGAGLQGGINHGTGIKGIAQNSDIRDQAIKVMKALLNFLAVIAVAVIIIAGIRMILSQGEEDGKEKAKKTIFYTLIGLAIILFARVIVGLVTSYLASEVA
jgi:zinc transporter ZupT